MEVNQRGVLRQSQWLLYLSSVHGYGTSKASLMLQFCQCVVETPSLFVSFVVIVKCKFCWNRGTYCNKIIGTLERGNYESCRIE